MTQRLSAQHPGDLILTGTPGGVALARDPQRFLRAGDVIEVTVEGVGTLRNPVRPDERAPRRAAGARSLAAADHPRIRSVDLGPRARTACAVAPRGPF